MFGLFKQGELEKAAAIDRSQAVSEFRMDGTLITANQKFLKMMGYALSEIQGHHHRMFVDADERDSTRYREFWARLNRGECLAAEYERVAKGGAKVWIRACYNPILDATGRPSKVIEFATDITARKMRSMEDASQVAAIDRSQAVISFKLDGTIERANEHFLRAMGYTLAEIEGGHHSMFVDPAERDCAAYQEFWARLNRGECQTGQFRRIAKGGREVWMLASYNPVLDEKGKPFAVVKFATDVTSQKLEAIDTSGQIEAIGRSQAVIEFGMDGAIIAANENFLKSVGYSLREIQGKHHSLFMTVDECNSAAYRDFWARLNRGEYQTGEYRRVGRNGKEIYIQASYNPILDLNGKPYKVVKYAADVTEAALARRRAERARSLIESVAAGSEEMRTSIRTISETMGKSKEAANLAVSRVQSANTQADRLNAAAHAMEGIVELIGDITGQINLLALNARIECARAGEAGAGFAVVTGEVRNLADQAKQATTRISNEITSLNAIAEEVVSTLNGVRSAIDSVSEFVASSADAIEEQTVVSGDMSSNMQRAAAELAV
ncbi:PAS domain-containing methyl-accepting chemotaxis protein [Bradyrhizobium sp. CCGUVB23]|uniref:methyl-accepting chemotaxis protein n=1 Tax=Bradyrhizobium sp. CCGUVB23 TaxID=2949630 RepID=UPI0020B3F91B|nr:PAS domain-containing methyl-accepting chemotaxis protein [Bradyrhizobium sp. CCGUVB23]MCP3463105.1 PAS domain-containing protein [Bradyrhizobium sp. CCGUVB23]